MKKYNYDGLKGDEQVTHNFAPLKFEIKDDYKFVITNKVVRFLCDVVCVPIFIILYIICKVFFDFTVEGRDRMVKDDGFVSISNHVHYLDCAMIGVLYYPRRVFYPTLEENFKIPVVRWLIRMLYAMPIPRDRKGKDRFYSEIKDAFKGKFILHMYPEAALWPYYEGVRDFKYGAFKIAVDSNVCVQPVRFMFAERKGIYKIIKRKKCIKAVILDPVYPDMKLKYKDRIEDLRVRTYEKMNEVVI